MKLTDPNYCAIIVKLNSTVKLEGLDNLVGAPILGMNALISNFYQTGELYVLLPTEVELSHEFCYENNLYDRHELNKVPIVKGYVSTKRRVRAIRLRGHNSNALLLKLDSLKYTGYDLLTLKEGDSFNELNGHEICKKYVVRRQYSTGQKPPKVRKLKMRQLYDSKLMPEHVDTMHWGRNHHKVSDDARVVVSQKLEGTSARFANQKVVRYPKWIIGALTKLYAAGYGNWRITKYIERLFRKFEYSPVAGSRRVIKLRELEQSHYYNEDVWNKVLDWIAHLIPKNWVIYGEIIGWDGEKAIQPKYTYHLPKGSMDFFVYRIAIVNEDGISVDLGYDTMKKWCEETGLKICPEIWRGKKSDFDYQSYMDIRYKDSGFSQCLQLSDKDTVDEGVVIRIEDGEMTPTLYKAKSPIFLNFETKQLDNDVVSIEDMESKDVQ